MLVHDEFFPGKHNFLLHADLLTCKDALGHLKRRDGRVKLWLLSIWVQGFFLHLLP